MRFVSLVLGLGLELSCPWPRECLSSERLSLALASDFFCVLGLGIGLEPCVLDSTSALYAAHQGVSAMKRRARTTGFWPRMTHDINTVRNLYVHCNRYAPSQAVLPPMPTNPPTTPFEHIFADFILIAVGAFSWQLGTNSQARQMCLAHRQDQTSWAQLL